MRLGQSENLKEIDLVLKRGIHMYCMYLRKSRADAEAEARGEGETLARHEKILFELAKRRNLSITKIHKEIVSGETISSRPVMQQLLNEVEQNIWEGVLVVEVERLARGDTIDQGLVAQTFKYSNTKIITPMKVYDPANEFDEEYFEFGLFMSRREYKTINRRLQRGRLESVKDGKYVGNKPPYGYMRKKIIGQRGYSLEPHPDQANVVKLIFDLYVNGYGISKIVRKLNDLKIPTVKGGDWVVSSIRGILSNPIYTGRVRWNFRPQVKKIIDGEMTRERPRAKSWDIFDGLHEAIIDQDVFNIVQKILTENPSTPAPKNLGVKNPLAGLVVCGKCGRKMVRRPYRDEYPDTLMCATTSCNNVSSQLVIVENRILQKLATWLHKYEIDIAIDEKEDMESDLIRKTIVQLTGEIETLEKQINKLHNLLEQGIYTTETFLNRANILNDKINTVKLNKEQLETKLKEMSIKEKSKTEIIPAIKKVINGYLKIETQEEKNKVLKEVLEKAVYTKDVSGRWHAKPDDFELILYPKLPLA